MFVYGNPIVILKLVHFRLWERKKDLIRGLVEVLGVPSSIKFYNKTEEIEGEGGLLILKVSVISLQFKNISNSMYFMYNLCRVPGEEHPEELSFISSEMIRMLIKIL